MCTTHAPVSVRAGSVVGESWSVDEVSTASRTSLWGTVLFWMPPASGGRNQN